MAQINIETLRLPHGADDPYEAGFERFHRVPLFRRVERFDQRTATQPRSTCVNPQEILTIGWTMSESYSGDLTEATLDAVRELGSTANVDGVNYVSNHQFVLITKPTYRRLFFSEFYNESKNYLNPSDEYNKKAKMLVEEFESNIDPFPVRLGTISVKEVAKTNSHLLSVDVTDSLGMLNRIASRVISSLFPGQPNARVASSSNLVIAFTKTKRQGEDLAKELEKRNLSGRYVMTGRPIAISIPSE